MSTIDITGIGKAELLAALYNNSRQQGMGLSHARGAFPMSPVQAQAEIDRRKPSLYFDYLYGRLIKTDLSGDSLDPWGYDRDMGDGAAAQVVDSLTGKVIP